MLRQASDTAARGEGQPPKTSWSLWQIWQHRDGGKDQLAARAEFRHGLPAVWAAAVVGSLFSLSIKGDSSPTTIPGTDLEPAAWVANLSLQIEVAEAAPAEATHPVTETRFAFKSEAPHKETALHSQIYSRANLITFEHPDTAAAESAFENLVANHNLGAVAPYARGHYLVSDTFVYRLHASCLLPGDSFQQMVSSLERAIRRRATDRNPRVATCRCGEECREIQPSIETRDPPEHG